MLWIGCGRHIRVPSFTQAYLFACLFLELPYHLWLLRWLEWVGFFIFLSFNCCISSAWSWLMCSYLLAKTLMVLLLSLRLTRCLKLWWQSLLLSVKLLKLAFVWLMLLLDGFLVIFLSGACFDELILAFLIRRPSELLMNDVAHVDPCNDSAPYTFDSLSNFHQVLPTHYHQQTLQPGSKQDACKFIIRCFLNLFLQLLIQTWRFWFQWLDEALALGKHAIISSFVVFLYETLSVLCLSGSCWPRHDAELHDVPASMASYPFFCTSSWTEEEKEGFK